MKLLRDFNQKTTIPLLLTTVVASLLLAGCGQSASTNTGSSSSSEQASFVLPTARPSVEPSPANTRVLPVESLTPAPSRTFTPIPHEALGLVVEVFDGDTIAVVLDGDPARLAYQVRYLGIEAPPNLPTNPWGVVAYETNRKLVNLKVVRLVRDETDFDDDGYLLRYVYLNDELINTTLVEQGLAQADIEPPNDRLETQILAAESRAQEADLGVWSSEPPTPTPGQPPPTATAAATGESPTGSATLTTTATVTGTVTVTATPTGATSAPRTPTATRTPTPTASAEGTTSTDGLRGE